MFCCFTIGAVFVIEQPTQSHSHRVRVEGALAKHGFENKAQYIYAVEDDTLVKEKHALDHIKP